MYVSQKGLNRGLEGALRYLATGSAGHRYLLIEIDDAFDLGGSRTGRPAAESGPAWSIPPPPGPPGPGSSSN